MVGSYGPLPSPGERPFIVEVRRGAQVESRHAVIAAVVDADGRLVAGWGDVESIIFPRSSNKAFQALPLIESGAADAAGLSNAEMAMACASHGGEARHTETVAGWLGRLGLDHTALECGAHWPYHEETARDLARAHALPTALHNNCSGKHAGMVTVAQHLGEALQGYVSPDHPVQRRVTAVIEDVCGVRLLPDAFATDGCSMPTMALPINKLAYGFARFVTGQGLAPERAKAAKRLAAAVLAEPFFVAGSGRFCTAVMQAGGGRFIAKTGAEGVYTAASAELGLGIALKVVDGTARAAQTALGGLLEYLGLLDNAARDELRPLVEPVLSNWRGLRVGDIGLEPAY
ncbi:asparaginase [Ferrovibrio sp.]|uniref:asparaginase n=1 Tax=Ferrovibrio sp. TaxID=1917215 RepID=UPI001B433F13|nr:asparaginase [Ferrovibrio sp.]MBP7064068.1 asparaginase [Ferrovibrio sp.]